MCKGRFDLELMVICCGGVVYGLFVILIVWFFVGFDWLGFVGIVCCVGIEWFGWL